MRVILHGVAIITAMVTLFVLIPSIRTGEVSIRAGMLIPIGALFSVYGLIVIGVGAVNGIPISHWPSIAKELFRGNEHDG